MESFADQVRSFLLALGLHVLLILFIWASAYFVFPTDDASAAGEPVRATLQASEADLRRAMAAIKAAPKAAEKAPEESAPPPQPIVEPEPETSDTPEQLTPQVQLEQPDTVDQEAISRLAQEEAEQQALEEQARRQRQDQAELTEDMERQETAERRQRLREQYEAARRERAEATRRTQLEEQRLQQLADMQASPIKAAPQPPSPPAGNRGVDAGLLARYKAAMSQTADQNWNHLGAPELTYCKVSFTQIRGGEVINVEFISCPYDEQGREFVDRALHKSPMPYSGFEEVFQRKVELTFCYPREDCQR